MILNLNGFKIPLSRKDVELVIGATLKSQKNLKGEVSVSLISDTQIKKLNKKYRGKDKVTDILSFPTGEKGDLGDIFLAPKHISSELEKFDHNLKSHYLMLLIHGLLHLIGYDHLKQGDFKKMRAREEVIVRKIEDKLKCKVIFP